MTEGSASLSRPAKEALKLTPFGTTSLRASEVLCEGSRISPLQRTKCVTENAEGFLRVRSAMPRMQSVSSQSRRKAVSDGFDAGDAGTSGTSVRRYRPCLNPLRPYISSSRGRERLCIQVFARCAIAEVICFRAIAELVCASMDRGCARQIRRTRRCCRET